MHRQHQHQNQQRHHHVLRHALQTALQVEAQDHEGDDNGDGEEGDVQAGVRDHGHKSEVTVLTREEFAEVVDDPAADDGIEGHEAEVGDKRDIPHNAPFLAGLLQRLIHLDRTLLGGAAHGELHGHDRQAQNQQAEDVHEHKSAAAVLAGHPREFPHVAAPDGAARREHDKP